MNYLVVRAQEAGNPPWCFLVDDIIEQVRQGNINFETDKVYQVGQEVKVNIAIEKVGQLNKIDRGVVPGPVELKSVLFGTGKSTVLLAQCGGTAPSTRWNDLLRAYDPKFAIIDPDGWDRRNWQQSWHDEEITFKEFVKRMYKSTVSLGETTPKMIRMLTTPFEPYDMMETTVTPCANEQREKD